MSERHEETGDAAAASGAESSVDELLKSLEQEMAEEGRLPTEEEIAAELAGEPRKETEDYGETWVAGGVGDDDEAPDLESMGYRRLDELDPEDIDPRQIFSELSDLFGKLAQGEGPFGGGVDWRLVRELAVKVATQDQPEPSVEPAKRIQIEELFKVAEMHVNATLPESVPVHKVEVMTRTEWITQILNDWKPHFSNMDSPKEQDSSQGEEQPREQPGFGDPAKMIQSLMVGLSTTARMMRVGGMLGELSLGAFGNYVLAVPPSEADSVGSKASGDTASATATETTIAIVEATVSDFSKEWSLDGDQVALWVCTQEIISHAVLSQPAVCQTLWHLYEAYMEEFDIAAEEEWQEKVEMLDNSADPGELLESLFGDTGELTIEFSESDEQNEISRQASAIASAVTAYVQHFSQLSTKDILGENANLAEAFRRKSAGESSSLGRQIFGLEIDLDAGLEFIAELERHDALDKLWKTEESLPTPVELESPRLWLARLELLD